jgi:nucleotide-binding universal stress UspA family protein
MYRTIVVGTDGSPSSLEAVRQAADLAKATGAELVVVSAARESAELMVLPEMAAAMPIATMNESLEGHAREVVAKASEVAAAAGVSVTTRVVRGEASDVLCHVAGEVDADLLVVGNKGMTGAKRFVLGSVPNRCAHHAPCSVLIVHTT